MIHKMKMYYCAIDKIMDEIMDEIIDMHGIFCLLLVFSHCESLIQNT